MAKRKTSEKTRAVLKCIGRYLADEGYAPTLREIMASVGISSTSVTEHHVRALEKRGLIRRAYGKARGVSLTAEGLAALKGYEMAGIKRYDARRDANEGAIREALKAVGASVYMLDQPVDLLVGWRGQTYVLEVKTAEGRLTPNEHDFFQAWAGGPALIVRSEAEALIAIGAVVKPERVSDGDAV